MGGAKKKLETTELKKDDGPGEKDSGQHFIIRLSTLLSIYGPQGQIESKWNQSVNFTNLRKIFQHIQ